MNPRDRLLERMRQGHVSILRPGDVALLFCVDRKTVSQWAKVGKLPHIRTPGGHRRFPCAPVLHALDAGDA